MQMIIIGCLSIVAVSNALAPWVSTLALLCTCHFVNGLAGGLVEAGKLLKTIAMFR